MVSALWVLPPRPCPSPPIWQIILQWGRLQLGSAQVLVSRRERIQGDDSRGEQERKTGLKTKGVGLIEYSSGRWSRACIMPISMSRFFFFFLNSRMWHTWSCKACVELPQSHSVWYLMGSGCAKPVAMLDIPILCQLLRWEALAGAVCTEAGGGLGQRVMATLWCHQFSLLFTY